MIENKKDEYSFKTVNNPESGRSMVEMLGVLAVVGVLSIGGILGYTNAMNKSRANELLNEANKRAVIYATQRNSNLSEFGTSPTTLAGGKMSNTIEELVSGEFGIEVTGVTEEVCEKLLDSIGDSSALRGLADADSSELNTISSCSGKSNLMMIFNSDMGVEANSNYKADGSCAEGHFGERCAETCGSGMIYDETVASHCSCLVPDNKNTDECCPNDYIDCLSSNTCRNGATGGFWGDESLCPGS